MRCAILRLVSRGEPTEAPREARDPEEIPPSPARLQDERAEGGSTRGQSDAVSWKARLRVSTSWKTTATDGAAEEMWEVRSKDETEKSQASANPDTPLVWGCVHR